MSLDIGLIGYWPFHGDCEDHSDSGLTVQPVNVALEDEGARFNGWIAIFLYRIIPRCVWGRATSRWQCGFRQMGRMEM